jgi:tetratricopeptide (TPR) repeat protein
MIALVFQIRSTGSVIDFSPTYMDSKTIEPMKQAESLRGIGKTYLSTKQYSQAASCYAAILQVLEGVGGVESGELRRRCGLTLAECEIKAGNLYSAIARCSEVIEECPDVLDEEGQSEGNSGQSSEISKLRQILGQAFYRRGVALSRLEEPHLALLDLQEASKKIPNDMKIIQRIEISESIIMNYNSSDSISSESELVEQLQCIVEDAQSNYQRSYFSKKQISFLLNKPLRTTLSKNKKNLSSGLEGLGDLFGAGSSSLGGAGGMGGLGSLLGNSDGKGMMGNIGMLLQMFGGFDKETVKLIEEIVKAITDVFQIFKKTFELIMKNKHYIILAVTFVWVITSLLPYLNVI